MTTARAWASARVVGETARRFAEGWRATPRTARRRWLAFLVVAIALEVGLLLLMIHLLRPRAGDGPLPWEPAFELHLIERSGASLSTGIWLQAIGTDILLWVVVLTFGGIAAWRRRPFRALSLVLAYLVLDVLVRVGWHLWPRHRPTLVLGGAVAPGFSSFPSGHTAKSFAIWGLLCVFWFLASRSWIERLLILPIPFALSCLTAFGRLRMGAHWPTDLLGGFVLGFVWLALLVGMLRGSGVETER